MKKIKLGILLINLYLFGLNCDLFSQVYYTSFQEGFENAGATPSGWTKEGLHDWIFQYGGYTSQPEFPLSKKPMKPHKGSYNALFQLQSLGSESAKLITPQITGLKTYGIHPVLKFWHAQGYWHGTDQLRVYFRTHKDSSWVLLNTYIDPTETPDSVYWVEREISLPVNRLSDTYYIAFEGTTKWGWGVCIDDISIAETGVMQKKIKSVSYKQPVTSSIPIGTQYNQILRLDLKVTGNTGSLKFKSLSLDGLNSSNSDIGANGVKLYLTTDSVFSPDLQLGTSQSFISNTATFGSLNYELPLGASYIWVTYDISSSAVANHFVDAIIRENAININDSIFPNLDISPTGKRELYETIFVDDFENDKGWVLSGEFERDHPMGKGGSTGSADPTIAFSGFNVLGTDLTGIATPGDYEKNLGTKAYQAISPAVDLKYYNSLQLSYYKWLNIDHDAVVTLDYSINNGNNWTELWRNNGIMIESKWSQQVFDLPKEIERQSQVKFRFTLGETSNYWQFSGWNIDDFILTADHITNDVGVVEWISPKDACAMSSASSVTVKIRNYADGPSNDTIPIALSLDNGATFLIDTVFHTIPKDGAYDFTFSKTVDLSKPDIYKIIAKTQSPGDKGPENDALSLTLYSFPVKALPFAENFDGAKVLWKSEGKNASWEWGTPGGSIMEPLPSSPNVWVTNLNGDYYINDSSWVVSPCFNFTNIDQPVIDFKYWNSSEAKKDGTVLQYSIDAGANWMVVPKHAYSQWKWNWYNDDNISALGGQGWDTTTNDWFRARQFLPADVVNKGQVRFRFKFASDGSNANNAALKGFAFDNFRIYNAPYDVGVQSIVNIGSNVCQDPSVGDLSLVIKNYGLRDLQVNDTMIVGVKVNNSAIIIDTFKLQTAILIGESKLVSLDKRVPISEPGAYTIKAFTMLDMEPGYYNTDNDTASFTFTVKSNPVTNLPDTVYSARPDTAKIISKGVTGYDYVWKYNGVTISTDSIVEVKNGGIGNFFVTVTDNNPGNGCVTVDQVYFKLLVSDVGVRKIISPITSCGYGTVFNPTVRIKNFETDILKKNSSIPIETRLSKDGITGPLRQYNYTLTANLMPHDSIDIMLGNTEDLSAVGTYTFMAKTVLTNDLINTNDSAITDPFQIYGYPAIELGPDVSEPALSHMLVVQPGYTYEWNDGSTNDTLIVTTNGKYVVKATNTNGCISKDSVNVNLIIHDLMIKRLISPVSSCTLPGMTSFTGKLMNNGNDVIDPSENIAMEYAVDGGIPVTQNLNLATQLIPGDSVSFSFTTKQDMSALATYQVRVNASVANDLRTKNDTVLSQVKVYGNPVFDLGKDLTLNKYEYKISAGNNWSSYKWQDKSTDSVYLVTQKDTIDHFTVTVTNEYGCASSDSVDVTLQIFDMGIAKIEFPTTSCTKTSPDFVYIWIKNTGNQDLLNKQVAATFSLNDGPEQGTDNFPFSGVKKDSVLYKITTPVNLTTLGMNKLKLRISYTGDVRASNDTLTQWVSVNHGPSIDFHATNGVLKDDLPINLDAGAGTGYTYKWSTNETTQIISATATGYYWVTVTEGSCQAKDSVYVIDNDYDLSLSSTTLLSSFCKSEQGESFDVVVKNTGNMTYDHLSFVIKYHVDSDPEKSQTVTFTGSPADSIIYTFNDPLDLSKSGSPKVYMALVYDKDEHPQKDTLIRSIIISETPVIDLGGATDTIKAAIFPVVLDATAGYTYKWSDGSTKQTLSVSSENWYIVTVTNGACTTKDSVFVRNATPVFHVTDRAKLLIYPNPVNAMLYVDLSLKSADDVTLDLISATGKMVIRRRLTGNTIYTEPIDVTTLPRGAYYIRVTGKDWILTDKVLIQ
jgi:hypothetical protein